MKILKIVQNCMGTLSFEAKFNGMRKPQDFIVYPMKAGNETGRILIQSDTRIGYIYLDSGKVSLCPPVSSGAYFSHLMLCAEVDTLDNSEMAGLKFRLVQTANEKAGTNGICYTDNSAAEKVSIF